MCRHPCTSMPPCSRTLNYPDGCRDHHGDLEDIAAKKSGIRRLLDEKCRRVYNANAPRGLFTCEEIERPNPLSLNLLLADAEEMSHSVWGWRSRSLEHSAAYSSVGWLRPLTISAPDPMSL